MSYRCQGCGKTSRIAAHEPGCPVDAAWRAQDGPPAVSTPEPDVRELAKSAVATIRQQARRVWNGSVIMLTSDGEIADAVLAAVSPVIRRQERAATAEEIAQAIEHPPGTAPSVNWAPIARRWIADCAAIARSHSQPTGDDHDVV